MLPDSVEPRAKMKITSLHAPFLSSSEVADCRVSRDVPPGMGLLRMGVAAIAQRKAVIAADWNFIFEVEEKLVVK